MKVRYKISLMFLISIAFFSSAGFVYAVDYDAEYWDTGNETSPAIPGGAADLENTTATINFDWGAGAAVGAGDGFVARWTKSETFDAGIYTFTLNSDDGSRFYFDDDLKINMWVDQSETSTDVTFSVAAGSHDVRVEYYENTGDAVAEFSYVRVDPQVSTLTPADDATGIAVDANLVMVFGEAVDVEAGDNNDIVIYKTDGDVLIETIDAQDAKVTGTGTTTITIDPDADLDEKIEYYIEIGVDAFDNAAGNGYLGIADTTTWSFTIGDFTDPTVSTLLPADDADEVQSGTDFVITFDEAVDVETGNITLMRTWDDAEVEVIDVTSGQVTGAGTTTITITPTATFDNYTEYYFDIDATAFDDTSSNSYAGISSSTAWSFISYDVLGGKNVYVPYPTVKVLNPSGGEKLVGGSVETISWSTENYSSSMNVDIYVQLSVGDGFELIDSVEASLGEYEWTVPQVESRSAMIKIVLPDADYEAHNYSDYVFSISVPEVVIEEIVQEVVVEVVEEKIEVVVEVEDIGGGVLDVEIKLPLTALSPHTGIEESVTQGIMFKDLVRGDQSSAVYYIDENLKRRPFSSDKIFFTWFDSFEKVERVTDATLALITLGAPMLPKEGVVLVKTISVPQVFVVEALEGSTKSVVRNVPNEEVAKKLFGESWAEYIIDVDVTLFSRFVKEEAVDGEHEVDVSVMKRARELIDG
jgi:hypothetical protein